MVTPILISESRLHDRGLVGLDIAYIVSGLDWDVEIRVLLRGVLLESSISSWLLVPAFDSSFELIFFRVLVFFRLARPQRLLYVYNFIFTLGLCY